MTAYFYKDNNGKIQQINLAPSEYWKVAERIALYNSKKEARRAKR